MGYRNAYQFYVQVSHRTGNSAGLYCNFTSYATINDSNPSIEYIFSTTYITYDPFP